MITKATITFGKHINRTFHFSKGINVLRGANEAGKSTVLEAIAYNAFGSGILAHEISEYHPKSGESLKTEVEYQINNVSYVLVRGKSGAELRGDDGTLVTNHGPVTAKMEQLLGVPPGKAAHTIYAAQNQIRGVMSLGPTATSQFIEQAAGFDQIDELVSKLENKLDTGNVKLLDSQVEEKAAEIVSLEAEPETDTAEQQKELLELEQKLAVLQQQRASEQAAVANAEQHNQGIRRQHNALVEEMNEIVRLKNLRGNLESAIADAQGCQDLIDKNEAQSQDYNRWLTYQNFLALPTSEDVWDGDWASMEAERSSCLKGSLEILAQVREIRADIAARQREKLTSTTCPITKKVCQELTNPELIASNNAEIDQLILEANNKITTLESQRKEYQETTAVLDNVAAVQGEIERWVFLSGDFAARDESQVPWKLSWKGSTEPADPPGEDTEALNTKIAVADKAKAQLEVLKQTSRTTDDVEKEIQALPKMVEVGQVLTDCSSVQNSLNTCREVVAQAQQNQHHRLQTIKRLQGEVQSLKDKRAAFQDNNDFIKAIKSARLLVTDMLWAKVLQSTSVYFSRMRGEQSLVERTPKGFSASGMRALSGSTLDVLAIALRITMAKLFTASPVMMVDEGSQGCDDTRTAAMTAALSGSGFNQVLMVTHKDVDEAADVTLVTV